MKKNLIALAALAAAGAASAQSNVQLYGVMDANFGTNKDTVSAPLPYPGATGGQRQTAVSSSGMRNSRWGLRGTEDLGGGLKASFVLEQGLNIDNGTVFGNPFAREASVGISGAFGSVKVGNVYSVYDDVRALTNNSADHNFAPTRAVWNTVGSADYNIRITNAVRYETNVYSGFSGGAVIGFGENKGQNAVGTVIDAGKTVALKVQYVNGPLAVGYAHQNQKVQNAATTALSTGTDSTKYNVIGASYDFGIVKLTGSYNKVNSAASSKDNEWQIGVSGPVGPVTVYVGYAAAKNKVNGSEAAGNGKATGYDLAAVYPLSKRTDLYTVYKSVNDKNAAGAREGEIRQFSVGVRHAF